MYILGQCANPNVAWQIDPFGHSREQARLFAQMGMDSLFFARADFRDKDQRRESKSLNMLWKGSGKSDGPFGMIFTISIQKTKLLSNEICIMLFIFDIFHLF